MSPRFPALDELCLTERQQELVDELSHGPRGGVGGPFKILIHRPELAQAVQSLGLQCRFDSALSRRQSELVILMAVREAKASYPWFAHQQMAVKAGVDIQIIESIAQRRVPVFVDQADEVIYRLAAELLETKRVSDQTFVRAKDMFGLEGVIDIVSLIGYYALISVVMNTFEFPMPEGELDPFLAG